MKVKVIDVNKILVISSIILSLIVSCKKDNQTYESIKEIEVFKGTAQPTDMSFANGRIGYISGSFDLDLGCAIIAKTIDGGLSWVQIPVYVEGRPSAQIRNIYAKSADSVYATYNSQDESFYGVCFSNNGGISWSNLGNFSVNGAYNGIFFKNSKVGFVCFAGDIRQTNDGGSTWNTAYIHEGYDMIGKLFFTSERIGYAYGCINNDLGSIGLIVKTTDGGNTWMELTSMQEAVTCLSFSDDKIGYAFTSDNNIYKTTDGGINWTFLNNITGQGCSYYSAIVTNKTKYFVTGWSVFKTTDDFKTVKRVYESPGNNANLTISAAQPSGNTIFFLSSLRSVIKINYTNN